MKPLTAHDVVSPLFNFTQLMIGNTPCKGHVSLATQEWLFTRLDTAPLPIKEALELEPLKQSALYELFAQYIMFLAMNSDLKFPPDFLAGTSELVLGKPLLAYMQEHRWPFPYLMLFQ
ncbi:hypothetical protein JD491_01505 [Aeromonas caviae]|uniref:hypothetical protein n=1 Tax=Aeromonas TaxID=642 RepID=UPI0019244000|nr:hypothetical protein [Aeromonas caviae]MBL0576324.1 hypothetical protein [Aeromonas caviae]